MRPALAGSQVTPEQIAAVGCGMEKNAVGILRLPGDGHPQQVLVPFRGLSSGSGQRQADGLRLVTLGDDPHQDVILPKSCNGEYVSLGVEELHAAVRKGRVVLFELAQAVVELVLGFRLDVLAPGHGVAAALVGAVETVDIRFISVVDGRSAGEQELEESGTGKVRIGDGGVRMEAAGIVAVEEVELVLLEGIRAKCWVTRCSRSWAVIWLGILLKTGWRIMKRSGSP